MVRKARLKDLPFVLSLSRNAFSEYGRYEMAVLKWFLHPGTRTFINEMKMADDDVLCGFVMLAPIKDDGDPELVLEVMAIAVSEKCRRQGVGTELLHFSKTISKDILPGQEPLKITLSVAQTNETGLSFFRKCGFQIAREARWRYPAGQRAYRMESKV